MMKKSYIIILAGLFLVSCDKANRVTSNSAELVKKNEVSETGVKSDIGFEEFDEKFKQILSKKEMQSSLTRKVDELCKHMDYEIFTGMINHASSKTFEGVSYDNWLLGFNQIMANGVLMFGAKSSPVLSNLVANREANEVIREYASQHYFRLESLVLHDMFKMNVNEKGLERLNKILNNSMPILSDESNYSTSLAGSNFIGLASLAYNHEGGDEAFALIQERIRPHVMSVLLSLEKYNVSTKSAAIHSASELKIQEAGPIIFQIAINKDAEVSDRLSAIGALRGYPQLIEEDKLRNSISRRDKQLKRAIQILIEDATAG